jgi:hypothetical protein
MPRILDSLGMKNSDRPTTSTNLPNHGMPSSFDVRNVSPVMYNRTDENQECGLTSGYEQSLRDI